MAHCWFHSWLRWQNCLDWLTRGQRILDSFIGSFRCSIIKKILKLHYSCRHHLFVLIYVTQNIFPRQIKGWPTSGDRMPNRIWLWSEVNFEGHDSLQRGFHYRFWFLREYAIIRSQIERKQLSTNIVVLCLPNGANNIWILFLLQKSLMSFATKPDRWSARVARGSSWKGISFSIGFLSTPAIVRVVVSVYGSFFPSM